MSDIGVIYIARGADPNWQERFARFVASYREHSAGVDHQLYIIFKEFDWAEDRDWAMRLFLSLRPIYLLQYLNDNAFGGGCFQQACKHVKERLISTLVSTTEIMHDDWLLKLLIAYRQNAAGLVGCTGSKEGALHVRDTAILIEREWYQHVVGQFDFTKSKDGYLAFEHGPDNLTIQTMRAGKSVFVVEKERIIAPDQWAHTTYRGNMENVLVHDRGARDFQDL